MILFNWGAWSQNYLLANVFIFPWQDSIPACVASVAAWTFVISAGFKMDTIFWVLGLNR